LYFCRYIVATQDKSLQNILYHIPAVPVMQFNGLSIILKTPSPSSIEHANQRKQSRYELVYSYSKILKLVPVFVCFLIFNYYLLIFRFNLTEHENNVLTNMKSSIPTELISSNELKDYPGIFKRAKGPNPLSCKPKQKKNNEDSLPKVDNKIKRKRKRIKIPKHVKEELKKINQQTSNT